MTELLVLQEGRARRDVGQARSRRRRRLLLVVLTPLLGAVLLLVFMAARVSGPGAIVPKAIPTPKPAPKPAAPQHPSYGTVLAPASERVRPRLKKPLRSGLLFDLRSGRVLWERNPTQPLAIASLTKMMTALVVVAHGRPTDWVRITRDAIHYTGSGVGLLPLGKRVPLEALLYGLLLPSGNDAAIALAEHVSGSRARFIALMNAEAHAMGLRCTHFNSVSGIIDLDNYSCASDLAFIAHAVLEQRRLARIVSARSAILPFPIKGGKLYLYNNNPLLLTRFPGTDGVKTGYTPMAGSCLVATARRGRSWLGVVLLHSGDPQNQAEQLLNAGFAKLAHV